MVPAGGPKPAAPSGNELCAVPPPGDGGKSGIRFVEVGSTMAMHILLILVIVDVGVSCAYAAIGTAQESIALLTCRIIPFTIALPALWRRKYWAWYVGIIFAAYDIISTALFLLPNLGRNWEYYQRQFAEHPIKASFDVIITHVLMLFVAILLVAKRSDFDE